METRVQWHYRPACNNSFVSVTQPYIIFLDILKCRQRSEKKQSRPRPGLELTTRRNRTRRGSNSRPAAAGIPGCLF